MSEEVKRGIDQAVEYLLIRRKDFKIIILRGASPSIIYEYLHLTFHNFFTGKDNYQACNKEGKRILEKYPDFVKLWSCCNKSYHSANREVSRQIIAICDRINKSFGLLDYVGIGDMYFHLIDRSSTCKYLNDVCFDDSDKCIDEAKVTSQKRSEIVHGYLYITEFTKEDDDRHKEFAKINGFSRDVCYRVTRFIRRVIDGMIVSSIDSNDTRDFVKYVFDQVIIMIRECYGAAFAKECSRYIEAVKNDITELDFLCMAVFKNYYNRFRSCCIDY